MPDVKEKILFSHAVGGCDTTSGTYRKGKTKFYKILTGEVMDEILTIFNDPDSSADSVFKAGCKYFLRMYSTKKKADSLSKLRFDLFVDSACKSTLYLASLPPTTEAVRQHVYRVYHQVQEWLGVHKPPEQWGWKLEDGYFTPIMTTQAAAPDELLMLVSCACTKGCSRRCSCKKAGLRCSNLCSSCKGISCLNAKELTSVDVNDEEEEDVDSPQTRNEQNKKKEEQEEDEEEVEEKEYEGESEDEEEYP